LFSRTPEFVPRRSLCPVAPIDLQARLRDKKELSQWDIEERTGLLRCYISRVENGHTVPSIETSEKMARALEIPMYRLFYDGDVPPDLPSFAKRNPDVGVQWRSSGKDASLLNRFRRLLGRVDRKHGALLLSLPQEMSRTRSGRPLSV
jgi:transcriptional regulator with XRE-family HTH domain